MKALLATVTLVTLGSAALAAEPITPPADTGPVQLSNAQLDRITAGGINRIFTSFAAIDTRK